MLRATNDPLPATFLRKDHFPVCIVFTPLPMLTWLCPIIGHLGVSTSDGLLHDFAGSYYIRKNPNNLAFGPVTKYLQVDPSEVKRPLHSDFSTVEIWDRTVRDADNEFEHLAHNILCNNCHDHCAFVLNRLQYKDYSKWSTLSLILLMAWRGRFVSFSRFLLTWLPFIVICIALITFSVLTSR